MKNLLILQIIISITACNYNFNREYKNDTCKYTPSDLDTLLYKEKADLYAKNYDSLYNLDLLFKKLPIYRRQFFNKISEKLKYFAFDEALLVEKFDFSNKKTTQYQAFMYQYYRNYAYCNGYIFKNINNDIVFSKTNFSADEIKIIDKCLYVFDFNNRIKALYREKSNSFYIISTYSDVRKQCFIELDYKSYTYADYNIFNDSIFSKMDNQIGNIEMLFGWKLYQ